MKSNVTVLVGIQWGDEGKGKVACHEAANASIVIRATGGNNAGHTVVYKGLKYALHLLPSSIMRPEVLSIIGPGVVIDPQELIKEIMVVTEGDNYTFTNQRLMISERAHVIFPYHQSMDKLQETLKTKKIGTTGKGIGPCYSDKANRIGIRMGDLIKCSEKELRAKIRESIKIPNDLFSLYGFPEYKVTENEIYMMCQTYATWLGHLIMDIQPILTRANRNGSKVVIEGAQAYSLDIDHGDYPFVTSSNPNAAGACSGAGIGPMQVENVIGIMKAYSSRVGEGPFPTELQAEEPEDEGTIIRELGHEYGTTTGRPRRCGWLDLNQITRACQTNGCSYLCVNHLDTIGEIGQKLGKICVCYGYGKNKKTLYKTFEGWKIFKPCKTYEELPVNAKKYIEYIEEQTQVKVKYIGIGADDNDVIIRTNI